MNLRTRCPQPALSGAEGFSLLRHAKTDHHPAKNLGAPGLDSETWENTDLNPSYT